MSNKNRKRRVVILADAQTHMMPALFAVLALCVLLGLVSGCSKSGKKDTAEFDPGGGFAEDMRDTVEDEIEDPDKKAEMLVLVDQMAKDVEEMDRVVQKLYADINRLNDNYNASPEEFRKVIAEFEASRKEVRDRIVDNRFKMRDLSTPEEWKGITHKKDGLYQKTLRQPS